MSSTVPPATTDRRLGYVYVVGGLIGFIAAFTLLVEKIALIEDPSYVPSCSINPILSCGSIMRTTQAEVFGFPNPILGVAAFAIIGTIGAALLAGARFATWFWWALIAGTAAGVGFVHWLVFQSLYRIDALCPYCIAVWVVTIAVCWYTALHVTTVVAAPGPRLERAVTIASMYHTVWLTLWYVAIAALIAQRFWYYWVTVLA